MDQTKRKLLVRNRSSNSVIRFTVGFVHGSHRSQQVVENMPITVKNRPIRGSGISEPIRARLDHPAEPIDVGAAAADVSATWNTASGQVSSSPQALAASELQQRRQHRRQQRRQRTEGSDEIESNVVRATRLALLLLRNKRVGGSAREAGASRRPAQYGCSGPCLPEARYVLQQQEASDQIL